MTTALRAAHPYITSLLTPIHPWFPIGLIDLVGAMRLSSVVDWMARGVFDPPPPTSTLSEKGKKSKAELKRPRATALQECIGILVVVFGGETFLSLCTGSTPSWLVSPKIALLFALTHLIQTRTSFRRLLPSSPSLALELVLALPDAIGRALLLTKFSILPLLHPNSPDVLPATPTTLLLVPFTLAVPFASLIFSTTNFFSPSPKLTTPLELRPGGWMFADTWVPVVIPILFLSLIGPVKGWEYGLRWNEDEAVVACIVTTWVIFTARAIHNNGYEKEQWLALVGAGEGQKLKVE